MADKIDKIKKRKRTADGSSKPSKRVAIENEKPIQVSLLATDKWAPIIASSPGLAVPSSIAFKPFAKTRRNAPAKATPSGQIATKELLLNSQEHPKLDYTAREEESGGTDTLLRHYVGVYDPETGKMEVMEARRMVVRGSVRAHQDVPEATHSSDMRELRNDLGKTFGTKKAKKAIASVTENAISPEKSARMAAKAAGKTPKLNAATTAILATMAEATKGMATKEEMTAIADAAKPRPKANTSATDIKDVYTIESLIGSKTLELVPVMKWLNTIKEKKEIMLTCRYPALRIQKNSTNVEKLKILRYMLLLLELYNRSKESKDGSRRLPRANELKEFMGEDIPGVVLDSVKRQFSDAGIMDKHRRDLLITHLCALAMLVDNYEVNITDLREDLKLELRPMVQYFREIGAKVVPLGAGAMKTMKLDKAVAAQIRIAKLKLPLDFPVAPVGRRAAKR